MGTVADKVEKFEEVLIAGVLGEFNKSHGAGGRFSSGGATGGSSSGSSKSSAKKPTGGGVTASQGGFDVTIARKSKGKQTTYAVNIKGSQGTAVVSRNIKPKPSLGSAKAEAKIQHAKERRPLEIQQKIATNPKAWDSDWKGKKQYTADVAAMNKKIDAIEL